VTDDMRARLEQLPTGELLAILRDRDPEEWRPEAFPLVEAILAARHVDVPAALENLRAAAAYVDFEALTEVATFSTSVDAHLCRMALEEAEIPCWIFNDHLAGVHVPLAMVIGVSVRVRPEDEAAAREILEAVRAGAVAAPEEAAPCPRCGTETVRKGRVDRIATLATALTTGPPLAQSKWEYRCTSCGHIWE
jgi:DNA-directed RNA polymerase subunit RPC12/RpoP